MRTATVGTLTITILLALGITHPCAAQGTLTVVSYGGGAYQDSHRHAFTEPFAKLRRLTVNSLSWGAEYGHLQEMVRSGRVPWDVVEVTAAQFARGQEEGLFAPLSRAIPSNVFQPLRDSPGPSKYGVPNVYWSTVLAYKTSAFPSNPPTSWSDFWNTTKFPGSRALYDSPRGSLEFALLADGVPLEGLYPLDVERAFHKLKQIRHSVRLWWKDSTEPIGALLSGRVVMSSLWSGRVYASKQARKEITYSWKGAAHELDYWVIPKGTENVGLASDFIAFASTAEPMARQAAATAYGPANRLAVTHLSPDITKHLSTAPENWDISFVINSEWWSKHEAEVQQRWAIWRSER